MPKRAKELTAIEVKRLSKAGFHAAGGVSGLGLRINEADGKSWILRTMVGSRRRDIGLGGYPAVPLTEARDRARVLKHEIANGIDPVVERRKRKAELLAEQKKGMTFATAVEEYLASSKLTELRNAKHRAQWGSTLRTYALPVLGPMQLSDIEPKDVKAALDPIWTEIHETATRVRGRIEKVLDWAKVAGHRGGDNPARFRGNLSELLPKLQKDDVSEHHPALSVNQVPAWFAHLQKLGCLGAQALSFLTLTAARSGEVRGALWSEIDVDENLWIVPAQRMKAKREHRVPLSVAARNVLKAVPRFKGSEHIFPSSKGGAMSDMTLSAVMRRMHETEIKAGRPGWLDPRLNRPAVPHGLRSSFRDWVGERTDYPGDLAEIALAHKVGSAVERAYRRGDMIEKRGPMMEEWATFVTGSIQE